MLVMDKGEKVMHMAPSLRGFVVQTQTLGSGNFASHSVLRV